MRREEGGGKEGREPDQTSSTLKPTLRKSDSQFKMEWQTEPKREGGSERETGNLSNAQMTVGKLEPTIRPSTGAGWIAACTVCTYVVRPDDVPSPPLPPSESPRATRGRRPNQSKVKLKTLPPSPPLYRQPRPPPSLSPRRCLVCVERGVAPRARRWRVQWSPPPSRRARAAAAAGGEAEDGRRAGGREGSGGSGLVLPVRRSVGRLRCVISDARSFFLSPSPSLGGGRTA